MKKDIKNLDAVIEAINKSHEATRSYCYGVRGDDKSYNIDDELSASRDFADDSVEYGSELLGTSAINIGELWFDGEAEDVEAVKKAIDKLLDNYLYDNLYIITGTDNGYGTDFDEILIGNAEVVCKIEVA